MKQEGINSTRLAEILGIQASGISHIMSGRNKPSFDFLLKLLQRFPQINPDWLLLDKGPMYRDGIKNKGGQSQPGVQASPGTQPLQTAQNSPGAQSYHSVQSFPASHYGTSSESGADGAMPHSAGLTGLFSGQQAPGQRGLGGVPGFPSDGVPGHAGSGSGAGVPGHAGSGIAGLAGGGGGGRVAPPAGRADGTDAGTVAGLSAAPAQGPFGVRDTRSAYDAGVAATATGGYRGAQAYRSGSEPTGASSMPFGPDNDDIIPSDSDRRGRPDRPSTTYATSAAAEYAFTHTNPGHVGNFTRSSAIERIVVFYKDKTFSEYQPG